MKATIVTTFLVVLGAVAVTGCQAPTAEDGFGATMPTGATAPATTPVPTGAATSATGEVPGPAGTATVTCTRVVVAAGDIVSDVTIANRTGRVAAAQKPYAVMVLGDNQYPKGSLADYRATYDHTTWGALKPVTRPVPGNHEYQTPGASGYYAYFTRTPAYYAYNLGCGWRAYALNSEISLTQQVVWLRRDLAHNPVVAVLAYWHQPRWSSGVEHGSNPAMQAFWDALGGRRGIVLNGHEHDYERFAPVRGVREFVVGTGGSSSYAFGTPIPGSQRRIDHTPGVLRLDLSRSATYRWAFLDVGGAAVDSGTS